MPEPNALSGTDPHGRATAIIVRAVGREEVLSARIGDADEQEEKEPPQYRGPRLASKSSAHHGSSGATIQKSDGPDVRRREDGVGASWLSPIARPAPLFLLPKGALASSTMARAPVGSAWKRKLSSAMSLRAFHNGYPYAEELRAFAVPMRIPFASKPRLRADLAIVHYTSNKETNSFIGREAAKIQPGFKRSSGTGYLLNRWREDQIAAGRRIACRDLVNHAIALNESKRGPLRVEHERYMNFISDFQGRTTKARHTLTLNGRGMTPERWMH